MQKQIAETAVNQFGLNVTKDKLKEVTKLYLEKKGLNLKGLDNESSETYSSSLSDCECNPAGHDPFTCRYGDKFLKIKGSVDWKSRIEHFRKV